MHRPTSHHYESVKHVLLSVWFDNTPPTQTNKTNTHTQMEGDIKVLVCGGVAGQQVRFIVTSPFGSMYIMSEGKFRGSEGERWSEREK